MPAIRTKEESLGYLTFPLQFPAQHVTVLLRSEKPLPLFQFPPLNSGHGKMLKELRSQHRTVIQMVFAGYKSVEIAERLEMSPVTVSLIIRSPLGQAYLEGLQDKAQEAVLDVRKKLVSMNSSALKVIERIMNPAEKAPHSVQLTAAKDVLDRTGFKAPDRLHVDMTMQTKTDAEIEAEIMAMQESIAKTYKQDPNKLATDQPKVMFTDEHPEQAELTEQEAIELGLQDLDLTEELDEPEELDDFAIEYRDSPDQLNNCPQTSNQDDSNDFCNESFLLHDHQSEESLSLLAKIPANIFHPK